MKTKKTYMRLCMLLFLFTISKSLFAQEQEIPKEKVDSTYQAISESENRAWSIFGGEADSSYNSIQTRACINSLVNQVISSHLSVEGCNTLLVQNVTVTNGGNLSILAPNDVQFNGTFAIDGTGILNINTLPPGNNIQKAIIIGTYGAPFQYSNSQNTNSFTNEYGRPTNDVYYKLILTTPMQITINHCGSSVNDTYLHLLDANGGLITYNDDYSGTGSCSNSLHSYLKLNLGVGTYYIVSEGYSANGVIQTSVIGELPQIKYYYDASGNRTSRQ